MVLLGLRVPISLRAALEAQAKRAGVEASALGRQLLQEGLAGLSPDVDRRRAVRAHAHAIVELLDRPSVVRLVCEPGRPCSYHADGGSTYERCPGRCDVMGCDEMAVGETEGGDSYCARHLAERQPRCR